MALIQIFFCIIFPFLLLSLQPSTGVETCGVPCGDEWIRFPFSLNTQPDRCGYPGFHLSCQNQTQTTITLPFNGEFRVESIEYWSQSILINDPDDCTPKRLLKGLNLSSTPFEPLDPQNYVIFNCSLDVFKQPTGIMYIPCLSGQTYSVVAVPMDRLDFYASSNVSCRRISRVSLPASAFTYGVTLTWSQPDCMSCERSEGICMFKSNTGLEVGCSGGFRSPGLPRSAKYGVALGLGIPLLFFIGLIYYLRRKVNNYNDRQLPSPEISIQVALAPHRLAGERKGLDVSTIEAYPTTSVSESGELPRPKDNTCSICLCEYQAKQRLRIIPDCNHYFHVSCIDDWLKLNATCPVCRNNTTEPSVQIASSSLPSPSR